MAFGSWVPESLSVAGALLCEWKAKDGVHALVQRAQQASNLEKSAESDLRYVSCVVYPA